MKRTLILITPILLCIFLFSACTSTEQPQKSGLGINITLTSIGAPSNGDINDFNTQSFKYSATITNYDSTDASITEVRPVLSDSFKERVLSKDIVVKVNKTVPKNGSIDIEGEIVFNAKGLTKEQIVGMEPFVKQLKISEEKTFDKSF